jgi:hypothetical protein
MNNSIKPPSTLTPYTSLEEFDKDLKTLLERVRLTNEAGELDLSGVCNELTHMCQFQEAVTQLNGEGTIVSEMSSPAVVPLQGNVEAVAASGKKYIWGLNNVGQLFRYENSEWKFIYTENHLFKSISVTKNRLGHNLFAVSLSGKLYRYNPAIAVGPSEEYPSSGQWCLEPVLDASYYKEKRFDCIAAISRKKIFALDSDGYVTYFKLPRRFSFSIAVQSAQLLGQTKMKYIDVGGSHLLHEHEIWGIGKDDNRPYRFDTEKRDWIPVEVPLLRLCISRDNAVFGIQFDYTLVKWDKLTFIPILPKSVTSDLTGKNTEVPEVILSTQYKLHNISAKNNNTLYGIEEATRNIIKISL